MYYPARPPLRPELVLRPALLPEEAELLLEGLRGLAVGDLHSLRERIVFENLIHNMHNTIRHSDRGPRTYAEILKMAKYGLREVHRAHHKAGYKKKRESHKRNP